MKERYDFLVENFHMHNTSILWLIMFVYDAAMVEHMNVFEFLSIKGEGYLFRALSLDSNKYPLDKAIEVVDDVKSYFASFERNEVES